MGASHYEKNDAGQWVACDHAQAVARERGRDREAVARWDADRWLRSLPAERLLHLARLAMGSN